jgi:hypothetical protein
MGLPPHKENTMTRKRKFTNEMLVLNLQWLAAAHEGENIGTKHINVKGSGLPSAQAYITAFGSLNAAKIAAGLPVVGRGRPRHDGGKVSKTGEAALAVLKAARVPLTSKQIAAQITMRELTAFTAKDKADAVRAALKRAGVTAVDGAYSL